MKKNKNHEPDFWSYARNFLHIYMPHVRNLSQRSIDTYKQSLNCYLNFLEKCRNIQRPEVTFDLFSREIIKNYVSWMLKEKKFSSMTCNLRITAIKSFLKYSSEEDITLVSIYHEACTIHCIKNQKKPILYLTHKELATLLKMPEMDTLKGRRNRMIMILLYDSAARVQELVDITLKDLHIKNKSPFITLTGKGNKIRNIPLMEKTVRHLNSYLREAHADMRMNDENRPLFYSNLDGKPHALSTDSISLILKKYAALARKECPDMQEKIHCHLIRKTRAMDLYRQGIALPLVMQILGHENIATTSSFYAFATVDMLHDAMEKANPEISNEIPQWKNKKYLNILYSLD